MQTLNFTIGEEIWKTSQKSVLGNMPPLLGWLDNHYKFL